MFMLCAASARIVKIARFTRAPTRKSARFASGMMMARVMRTFVKFGVGRIDNSVGVTLKPDRNSQKAAGILLIQFTIATLLLTACGGGGNGASQNPSSHPDSGQNPYTKPVSGVISLFAGDIGGEGNIDALGTAARFKKPANIAVDGAGNLYVTDQLLNSIRKVAPDGIVTTLAGSASTAGSADGTGATGGFNGPGGMAADQAGNLYVADSRNHTIRKVTPAGVVTTLAGTAGAFGSDDGLGATARFNAPSSVAVDGTGNLYVADYGNSTVRKVTAAGVVTTLAGTAGRAGAADGTGGAASFGLLKGIAVDSMGNVYVTDTSGLSRVISGPTIRKITPGGIVTTLAGMAGFEGSANGTGASAHFSNPSGIAIDGAGNLYVGDTNNSTIRKITPAGVVTTLAGTAGGWDSVDGIGAAASFRNPGGVAVDVGGNVYVADTDNATIRKITSVGVVSTLAGAASLGGAVDGIGAAARFNWPYGVAADRLGSVYVTDYLSHTIRKITPSGVVTTLTGTAHVSGSADGMGASARFNFPADVAVDGSGNIYVNDSQNNAIRKITSSGVVTTLTGNAGPVAVDGTGNVYVASNYAVRKIMPAGAETTLAGTAGINGFSDGAGASARFSTLRRIAVDGTANVYVADGDTIRKITPAGVVTTLAGTAGISGFVDGVGAAARFNEPSGLAVDGMGNVFVADRFNSAIRKITPTGVVTTIAGQAGAEGILLGSLPASITTPSGLTIDPNGVLYVTSEQAVLKIQLQK
jgi:sugar lactone lactonase YvrE